jgi:diacylglycerol kinase
MSRDGYFQARLQSIRIALDGVWQVLQTQQNARIHLVAALIVFLIAGLLGISGPEWALLLLVVGFVWTAEMFNTAIEELVDQQSPELSTSAKRIKDISAGAVLVSALIAVLVGLLIFGPRLWIWIMGWYPR